MNLSAFPFFSSLQEMLQACKHGEHLLTSTYRFLPFQIRKPKDGKGIDCINVYHLNGTLYRTIHGNDVVYDFHQTADLDFITYYGATLLQQLACGTYYLEIGGRYSAIFDVLNGVDDLLKVEWFNTANLMDNTGKPLVIYQTGYMQRLHLRAEVLNPVYPYAETGNENEYKEFFADFKRVTKQSQFNTLLVPEYLVDALGALPIHNQVHIGAQREVKEIEVSPDWLDYGTAASVNVRFSEATPVIAMGCNEELELTEVAYASNGYACGLTDTTAYWVEISYTCELSGGLKTGYKIATEEDQNPNSATHLQTRQVRKEDQALCAADTTYYSYEQSEWVQKNDCPDGYRGTEVKVVVEAGSFTSIISQIDANNKALNHLNSIKQETANIKGTCELIGIYSVAGYVAPRMETQSQSCTMGMTEKNPVYTSTGQLATGDIVYSTNTGTTLATGFYMRLSDNKVMSIHDGIITDIQTCTGGTQDGAETV